jgi:tetratricopeptide (TPR) repeat protein
MKCLLLAIVLWLMPLIANSAPCQITYLEGTLTVRDSNGLRELAVGDQLEPSQSVTFGKSSLAEISVNGARIFVTRAGTYKLSDLFSTSVQRTREGILALLGNKVLRISSGYHNHRPMAGGESGVRANISSRITRFVMVLAKSNPVGAEVLVNNRLIGKTDYYFRLPEENPYDPFLIVIRHTGKSIPFSLRITPDFKDEGIVVYADFLTGHGLLRKPTNAEIAGWNQQLEAERVKEIQAAENWARSIEYGEGLLESGQYKKALRYFQTLEETHSTIESKDLCQYYEAYIFSRFGDISDAWRIARNLDSDLLLGRHQDVLFLKVSLLMDSLSYEEAIKLLDSAYFVGKDRGLDARNYLERTVKEAGLIHRANKSSHIEEWRSIESDESITLQSALYLAGDCYKCLSDKQYSSFLAQLAIGIDAFSDVGLKAQALLDELR